LTNLPSNAENFPARLVIAIPLNDCPLVLAKVRQACVAHMRVLRFCLQLKACALHLSSQLLRNRAPCLDLFSFAQQDQKFNGIDIINIYSG